jgi:Na+-driven multidrug efflux pump
MGSELLKYLLISILFIIPLTIINSAMEALGYAKATMISMLVGGIAKVIFAYCLIGTRRVGIMGAPISTIVFYGVALIVSLIFSYKKTKTVIPIAKSIFIPLVNSFIAIYTFYPVYIHISTKINWMLSLTISVTLSMLLYVGISSLEKNKRILSILKYRMHK